MEQKSKNCSEIRIYVCFRIFLYWPALGLCATLLGLPFAHLRTLHGSADGEDAEAPIIIESHEFLHGSADEEERIPDAGGISNNKILRMRMGSDDFVIEDCQYLDCKEGSKSVRIKS